MKTRVFIILLAIAAAAVFSYFFFSDRELFSSTASESSPPPAPTTRVVMLDIESGITYTELMENQDIGGSTHIAIYNAAKDIYDLADIRAGEQIELTYDIASNELVQLMYQTDTLNELFITRSVEDVPVAIEATDATSSKSTHTQPTERTITWTAALVPIAYEIRTRTDSGTIESSLYVTGLEQDMDERAIIALADVFQWTIDYAWGIRTGDQFEVIYEERYRDGEYIMPGKVLAAKFINDGTTYQAYYFEESEDNKGHFDENGNSVRKIFLKAPLSFKYISSGFTTKARFVSNTLGWTSSHKAIDYAAAMGTPVRSVGDGTVISAGWNNQGYGNMISIRHNETYTTNYAHLSRIYVSRGERVSQSEVIGAVGSTGFSSGPHLHYELVKRGTKVNPLTEVLPPGKEIAAENKERYDTHISEYQYALGLN